MSYRFGVICTVVLSFKLNTFLSNFGMLHTLHTLWFCFIVGIRLLLLCISSAVPLHSLLLIHVHLCFSVSYMCFVMLQGFFSVISMFVHALVKVVV